MDVEVGPEPGRGEDDVTSVAFDVGEDPGSVEGGWDDVADGDEVGEYFFEDFVGEYVGEGGCGEGGDGARWGDGVGRVEWPHDL